MKEKERDEKGEKRMGGIKREGWWWGGEWKSERAL